MALTFDQYLAIAGLAVGIVGVFIAIRSDQKMRTAQAAEAQIEKKFMHYMAAQEFEKLASDAVSVMARIRRSEWASAAQLTDNMAPALGMARGARNRLLEPLEKDMLDAAAANVQQFMYSLPVAGGAQEISEDRIQMMLSRCRTLVDVASEISGRLRVESIQLQRDLK